MRKYSFLLFLLFQVLLGFGQDFNLIATYPQVTKPEPSVSSLMKFEEIPVSNYTGVPDISIPIFNLPTRSKDITLDLTLAYHPSSVAMDEIAGECGLGWSLFSGGAITREVIGKPDEYSNGYADVNQNDIYQFNFLGRIGRFYLNKDSQGVLNVKILENIDSKLVITVNYNTTTYVIDSFTVYDDKGYKYIFQDFDTQTYYSTVPVNSYKSTFFLTKVSDNNNKDLVSYSYDTYNEFVNSSYSNFYKKCKSITSIGYGKINFYYSTGSNLTYNSYMRINRLDLLDYNNVVIKKKKFIYMNNDKSLYKVENCNPDETIKETYEFKYKEYINTSSGTFIADDWGYRKYVPNCLYSYPINNLETNINVAYCDMGVLSEIYLPTGGSIQYQYESNTYSLYYRNPTGTWQLIEDPVNYYNDDMPENYIVSTLAYNEFLGNGNNTYTFSVPGTGTTPVQYNINIETTPYTAATIDPQVFIGADPNEVYYPYLTLNGYANNNVPLTGFNNSSNLCQGDYFYLYPGQTYTITINAFGNNNKKGKFHITKRENKPNPSKNIFGSGIRIKRIAYFDKKVVNYFNDIDIYNSQSIYPSKQKFYSYNFFNTTRSSGAIVYPGSQDASIISRIRREPIGYKNVTVNETNNGREEFTYTSPMDFTYPFADNGLKVIYYDYRRGLLTNKKTYNQSNFLMVDTDLSYDYVETPNSTVFFDNPALNERLGWAKLIQRITKNYFSNSLIPITITENFTYDDAIRKLATKTRTNSLGETLKTQYTYHVGNSIYSQNRIAELEKQETFRGTDLLFSKKIVYNNSWTGNLSFQPSIVQCSKGSQPLENISRITNYDEFSNPIESQQENGVFVTYLWGYNKTQLIAKIENASNSQVATALGVANVTLLTETNLTSIDALRNNTSFVNSLITTYTYIPLVGISTITDPKADKVAYEYDTFGRLIRARDKNNKIITENVYYLSQTSTDFNAITKINYKTETTSTISLPSVTDAITNKVFYDGLGRPVQEIGYQLSSSNKDIVKYSEYDNLGRVSISYLPYTNSVSSLNYNSNVKTEILNYSEYVGQFPYSERIYDGSPLNRVVEQSAPGADWRVNNTEKHTIRYDYQSNQSSDLVRMFKATADESLLNSSGYYGETISDLGFYPPNELFKLVTKNENWKVGDGTKNTIEEYKDKEGRVVLKRTYSVSVVNNVETFTTHDLYFVYDRFNNLSFVLPPKADGVITADVLNELCYQYRYDQKNRLVEKKLPGKQWEFIVYDKLNRVVAIGPALSPFSSATANTYGWLIAKYDALNRKIITAWQAGSTTSLDRKNLQTSYSTTTLPLHETKSTSDTTVNNVAFRYTTQALPVSGYHIMTVNYFDDYNFTGAPTTFTTVMNDNSQAVYYNNTTFKPKGLVTGSWNRFMESITTTPVRAEITSVLYDNKARVVRTRAINYLTGYTQVDSKIDFSGKVLFTETKHKRMNADPTELYIKEVFTYSAQDRLLTHTHQIGTAGTPQVLSQNSYSELGRLITKKVGNTIADPMQKLDFSYNIRGWLTGINDVNNLTDTPRNDLFAFKINYNTVENEVNYTGTKQYNGNISETYWRSAKDNVLRKYGYEYDGLNRLKNAVYQKPGAASVVTNSYNESATYDKNGNIMTMQRNGDFDDPTITFQMDNLVYGYDTNNATNRLIKVTDTTNSTIGFNDAANTVTEFGYDANGNMTRDDNKGIVSIRYNHLNLPTEIVFSGSTTKKINFLYSGQGEKLQKVVTSGTSVVTTDYLGGFQYRKASATSAVVLQFFPHAEGYVNNTVSGGVNNYNYIYTYKDQTGNVRLVYTRDATTGNPKILEESNYYPYGLQHTNYNWDKEYYDSVNSGAITIVRTASLPYKYKYNSQEYQDDLSLNVTAMDFRQYDGATGRFSCIDLLAESSLGMTPYHFGNCNPVYWSDPSGLEVSLTQMLEDFWRSSGSGTTTWVNEGGGIWTTNGSSGGGGAGGGFYNANDGSFTPMVGVTLPPVILTGSSSSWSGQIQQHVYNNSPFYSNNSQANNNSNQIGVNDVASFMQDTGDIAMLVGTVMVFTGFLAPIGAALITYGGYTSVAGAALELGNDAYNGQWSNEKAITKTILGMIPMRFAGQRAFNYFGAPAANELLNLGTIGADRLLDGFRDANAGPYRN